MFDDTPGTPGIPGDPFDFTAINRVRARARRRQWLLAGTVVAYLHALPAVLWWGYVMTPLPARPWMQLAMALIAGAALVTGGIAIGYRLKGRRPPLPGLGELARSIDAAAEPDPAPGENAPGIDWSGEDWMKHMGPDLQKEIAQALGDELFDTSDAPARYDDDAETADETADPPLVTQA